MSEFSSILTSVKIFLASIPETLSVLIFGIVLVGLTILLRRVLDKFEKDGGEEKQVGGTEQEFRR